MAQAFDLTPTISILSETPLTGSGVYELGALGGSAATLDGNGDLSGSILSFFDNNANIYGAFMGSLTNNGAQSVFTLSDPGVTGSWGMAVNNWGANGGALENHDHRYPTSDLNPNIEEGINSGEYNAFPIPAVVPGPILHERDATRFQKTYSWQRIHPVRIRIYKR